jgi:hypothetical protein
VGEAFWAFETQGVVPDIVTLGKPIGNGFPMGAVVASRAVAQGFSAAGMEYFNTWVHAQLLQQRVQGGRGGATGGGARLLLHVPRRGWSASVVVWVVDGLATRQGACVVLQPAAVPGARRYGGCTAAAAAGAAVLKALQVEGLQQHAAEVSTPWLGHLSVWHGPPILIHLVSVLACAHTNPRGCITKLRR